MDKDKQDLASLCGRLAGRIDNVLSPGEIAELRHAGRQQVGSAYPLLAVDVLEPAGALYPDEEGERDVKWRQLLSAFASLRGQHQPGRALGRSLVEAGVSEARLLKLLRARGRALDDALRGCVHPLQQKAVPVNFVDLAYLVLSEGGPNEESIRRRIARDYFRAQNRTATEASK